MHVLLVGAGGAGITIEPDSAATTAYVGKPFSYGELRLRLATNLRRTHERRWHGRLSVGDLELDPAGPEVPPPRPRACQSSLRRQWRLA